MKKLLIYCLGFSILMLIFVGICLAVITWGQEGCGEWKYRWVKQECMWSLDLPGIQTLVWTPLDTCWQQERYWVPKPCPDSCGFWKPTHCEKCDSLVRGPCADTLWVRWDCLDSTWIEIPCPKENPELWRKR